MLNGLKLAVLLLLVATSSSFAQCATPDFALPSAACKGQRISLAANNTYNSYQWDLCAGELSGTPTATILNNNYGGYGFKMDLVEDGGDYYGFFLSRGSNKFYRLDFGANVNDPPLLFDLGGLGKSSNTWHMIEIVKEGSNFIGFIIDDNTIYRANFGTSITSTPTLETFYTGDPLNLSLDAVAVQEGSEKYLFVANGGNEKIVRIKFSSSYAEPSSSTTIDTFTIPFSVISSGLSFIKDCDKWYAVSSSIIVANVYKIAFDDGLSDPTPTITTYGVQSAGNVAVVKDNNTFMIFAQSLNSTNSIFRLTFGSSLAGNPVSTDELKDFGYPPGGTSVFGFAMYKVKSDWLVVSAENSGGNMYRITFPQSCLSSATWTTEVNPTITTANSGNFNITLDVTNASGLRSSVAHSVAVSSSTSPDIEFASTNVCAGHNVNFNSENTSGDITSYNWDFDDMGSSNAALPVHSFAAGTYDVSLTATASSTGCSNTAIHSLKIYTPPVADFQLPSGLVCTNNQFTFSNLVPDIYDGKITYQWLVDGTQQSTQRDLAFTFSDLNDKTIKLIAAIPGCSDEKSKSITGLLPGPVGAFTIGGQCQNNNITFTNQSSGSISSYSWDLGNGQASSSTNTSTTYNAIGKYNVVLNVNSTNSCVTTVTKQLTIYSTPQPAFAIDLPPFSCSGTPSQFHDATPSMTDGNVQSWNWAFGDSGSGSGKDPLHTYANAGPYTVRLTATTDRGCSNFVDQQVTITQSPIALFNFDPTCVNKVSHFTDASTGGVTSWQWKVGSASYNTQHPAHTFVTPGNYNVQLVVTGQNNCTASLTRPVIVPVVPTVDFQVTNPCAGQAAVFSDNTVNPTDPIAQRTWTFNGTGTGTGQQASYTFDSNGSYPVQLNVQGQSGCSYSTTKTVVIKVSPVASFTMSDQSGPPPLHVLFTNTSTGAISYVWAIADGSAPSTNISLEHTFAALGDYNVSLTATNTEGCSRTEIKIVNVITPQVELALEDFLLQRSGGSSSYQGYVKVRNNSNYRVTSFIVNYEVGGGIMLSETVGSDLSVGEVKTYGLTTTFTQPSASAFVCAELNADNNVNNNKACTTLSGDAIIFTVSPNPADSYINVESVHSAADEVRVRIYNMSGGVAYDKTFDVSKGLSRLSLDTQNLSPGIYVVVIISGNTGVSQKVLIAR
ncbi:MAG: PKD domain-containing protein [Bacteroidota bacterium]